MSVDNAWRRFGVTEGSGARGMASPVTAMFTALFPWNAVRFGLKALCFTGTFVLGVIALVRIVDALLDRLHNGI